MLTLGVAGTAKNTGKTTAATALLAEAGRRGIEAGLTGIGFDGEDLDNVTGLPKPRILVEPGTWVAAASGCLAAGDARIEPALRTGVATPLGEVVIGVVRTRGRLVLAGPNKRRDVRLVLDRLRETPCSLCLVDGALGRIVPLVETDALILATGAARTADVDRLAGETAAIAALLDLPGVFGPGMPSGIALGTVDGRLEQFGHGCLLVEDDVRRLMERVSPVTKDIFIPGIVTEECLAQLVEGLGPFWAEKRLVFASGPHLLAFGRPEAFHRLLAAVSGYGGGVAVGRRLPLLAVTVNPFHPEAAGGQVMRPAWVDAAALEKAVRAGVSVPVVDVARTGAGRLGAMVESLLSTG